MGLLPLKGVSPATGLRRGEGAAEGASGAACATSVRGSEGFPVVSGAAAPYFVKEPSVLWARLLIDSRPKQLACARGEAWQMNPNGPIKTSFCITEQTPRPPSPSETLEYNLGNAGLVETSARAFI